MPIHGLTDKRRWSRVGKVRIGEKGVSERTGKEYPKKLDYFLFDPYEPVPAGLLESIKEKYGERPQELTICLPAEDSDIVFSQYYKCYNANGLICKGDGQCAERIGQSGTWKDSMQVDCPSPEHCDFALSRGMHGKPGCKQVASLQFFMPDLPGYDIWQIDTSSFNSIVNINTKLDVMRRILGKISFIECTLVVRPQEAHNPDDGKKITIYVLDINVPHSIRDAGLVKQLGMSGAPMEALPAPIEDKAPDDLYARSQIAHDPTPDEDGVIPEEEPEPSLADDPEVQEALLALPAMHRGAMLSAAAEKGWDKVYLFKAIAAGVAKLEAQAKPKPKPKPVEPEPEPEPAEPLEDDGFFGGEEGEELF
jgi:hypothetical protein